LQRVDALGTAELLRKFLLWLAAASAAGTAVELAILRHWRGLDQLVPWAMLAIAAVTIALVMRRPTPGVLKAARVVGTVVALSALVGVYEHVSANYHDGARSRATAAAWATMSEPARWLAALDGSAGQAPPVAPGVLAQVGVLLVFATVGHPVRERVSGTGQSATRTRRTLAASAG
jgi:hypothetical protein